MITAIKFWNEPGNPAHRDSELDPARPEFSLLTGLAARAVHECNPGLLRVLGGISPAGPDSIRQLAGHGLLEEMDVVAVQGFPLDWSGWTVEEWPERVAGLEEASGKPVWVTAVGASSFGADEVQLFGLQRMTQLLMGRVGRVYWYSLLDQPPEEGTATVQEETERSSYHRQFYMGLIRADGSQKPALRHFDPRLGICQWFDFQDHRLDFAVDWLRRLGVTQLRTGINWADWHRPGGVEWFDRQMAALADFDVTLTLCLTPPSPGRRAPHASPPPEAAEFAEFAVRVIERYAPARDPAPWAAAR